MLEVSKINSPTKEFSEEAGIVQDVPSEKIQSECSSPDELQLTVNVSEDLSFSSSPDLLSPSSSTQTTNVLSSNTPCKTRYRRKLTELTKENKRLKNTIQLSSSSSQNLENITLEQYKILTKKFCSSPELADFINVQVSECQKKPQGPRYSEEFKTQCLAMYFAGPKLYKQTLVHKFCLPRPRTYQED